MYVIIIRSNIMDYFRNIFKLMRKDSKERYVFEEDCDILFFLIGDGFCEVFFNRI